MWSCLGLQCCPYGLWSILIPAVALVGTVLFGLAGFQCSLTVSDVTFEGQDFQVYLGYWTREDESMALQSGGARLEDCKAWDRDLSKEVFDGIWKFGKALAVLGTFTGMSVTLLDALLLYMSWPVWMIWMGMLGHLINALESGLLLLATESSVCTTEYDCSYGPGATLAIVAVILWSVGGLAMACIAEMERKRHLVGNANENDPKAPDGRQSMTESDAPQRRSRKKGTPPPKELPKTFYAVQDEEDPEQPSMPAPTGMSPRRSSNRRPQSHPPSNSLEDQRTSENSSPRKSPRRRRTARPPTETSDPRRDSRLLPPPGVENEEASRGATTNDSSVAPSQTKRRSSSKAPSGHSSSSKPKKKLSIKPGDEKTAESKLESPTAANKKKKRKSVAKNVSEDVDVEGNVVRKTVTKTSLTKPDGTVEPIVQEERKETIKAKKKPTLVSPRLKKKRLAQQAASASVSAQTGPDDDSDGDETLDA